MMVETHQVMTLRRFAQRRASSCNCSSCKYPGTEPGTAESAGDAPVADVDHRFQQRALHRRLGHDLRLVVIAGNPAGWRTDCAVRSRNR
jgi:hypothetical protein